MENDAALVGDGKAWWWRVSSLLSREGNGPATVMVMVSLLGCGCVVLLQRVVAYNGK